MKSGNRNHANPSKGIFSSRILIAVAVMASALAGCRDDPMRSGAEYAKKGEYKSAVIEFKNAVQAKPEAVDARLALADALERTHDVSGAEQQLRKALERGANPDELVPRIALMMLDTNQTEKIINEFKDRRLKSSDADSSLRGIVASAYLAQKRIPLAESQIKAATTKSASILTAQAQLLLTKGKSQEAFALLDEAAQDATAPWWVLRAISRVSSAMGKPARSLDAIKRAHEMAPWHRGVAGEYGEALFAAGQTDQALALKEKLKKEAPNYFWTHYLNAVALALEGRSEASHAAALKVLAVSPEHLPAALLAASAEIKRGDYLMADMRLQKTIKQHPYSLEVHRLYAKTQFVTGKTDSAGEITRRGLEIAPSDLPLLGLKADIELKRGARKEAIATLEQVVGKDPGDALSLLRLSQLKAAAGNKAASAQLLNQAADAGKDTPELRDRIIAAALRRGDVSMAQKLAEYAIGAHPKDPRSHLSMAATRGTQNDLAGAWKSTLTALDLDPAFHPALVALSAMVGTPEQRQELEKRFAKAVEQKSASAQVFIDEASLLRVSGKSQKDIVAVLERGVTTHPTSAQLRRALADEYFRLGEADKALSLVQAGASAANAPAEATALLASTYDRLGKTEQAVDVWRKLAANYPQRTDWRLRLAQIEATAGRTAEATTVLRSLITERPFDAEPYIALANLAVRKNPAEAQSIARQLADYPQHKAQAMLLEGELLVQTGNTSEALKQFSRAEKAGILPEAALRSVRLLDMTNNASAADQLLRNTLDKFPDDAAVLGLAAQRALAQGKPDKAVELLQKIVAKNPNNAPALNDLAWAQVVAKKPEALHNAARAAFLLPNAPEVLDTLAMAQLLAGKREQSIANLRAAINLAPTAPTPRIHLAEQLAASGDRQGAAELVRAIDSKRLSRSEQEILENIRKAGGN